MIISSEELESSSLMQAILEPDLDLYSGEHDLIAPNCDGLIDSLSISVGFTAVRAASAEQ